MARVEQYHGDLDQSFAAAEDDGAGVRGILVAADFDGRAKSAAHMVPNLALRRCSIQVHVSEA